MRALRAGAGLTYKLNRTALTSVALGADFEVNTVQGNNLGNGVQDTFTFTEAGDDPRSSAAGTLIVYVDESEAALSTDYTIDGGSVIFEATAIPADGLVVRIAYTYAVHDTFPVVDAWGAASADEDTATVWADGVIVAATDYTIAGDGSIVFDALAEPAADVVITVKIASAAAAVVIAGDELHFDTHRTNRPSWDSIIPSATQVCEVM